MGGVANFFTEMFTPKSTDINTKKENQLPDEEAAKAAEEERRRRAAAGGGLRSGKGAVAQTLSGTTGASTLGGGA